MSNNALGQQLLDAVSLAQTSCNGIHEALAESLFGDPDAAERRTLSAVNCCLAQIGNIYLLAEHHGEANPAFLEMADYLVVSAGRMGESSFQNGSDATQMCSLLLVERQLEFLAFLAKFCDTPQP